MKITYIYCIISSSLYFFFLDKMYNKSNERGIRMKKFSRDFKKFITKGNVLDLAVAVIIGGAFSKIIGSLVKDILMPVISLVVG